MKEQNYFPKREREGDRARERATRKVDSFFFGLVRFCRRVPLSLSSSAGRRKQKNAKKKTSQKTFRSLSLLTPLLAEARSASRALRDAAASAGLQRRRSAAAARRRAAASADAASAAAAAAARSAAAGDDATISSPAPSAALAPASAAPRGLPPRRRRPGLLPGAAARAEAPDHGVQSHQGEILD